MFYSEGDSLFVVPHMITCHKYLFSTDNSRFKYVVTILLIFNQNETAFFAIVLFIARVQFIKLLF